MKKLISLMLLLLCATIVFAQGDQSVDMADAMRSSGKIYVVVAVIVVIFIGLALYLFSIDRRLKKIEKENRIKNSSI
jgi:CcmD family protein